MHLLEILHRVMKKPSMYVVITILSLFLIMFAKWRLAFPFEALLLFSGGLFGIYIREIAEEAFDVHPSPFETVIFFVALSIVSFYLITSSAEYIAKGICFASVLNLYFDYVYDFWKKHTLQRWFDLLIGTVPHSVQHMSVILFGCVVVVFGYLLVLA